MAEMTSYPDGAPCWADLTTPDLAAARRFYGEILGWTFDDPQPEMGNYMRCRVRGKSVAGMSPPMPGQESMPPVWSVYLSTSDADQTAQRIRSGGGQMLVEPMEIPGLGRMLFGLDSTGAAVGAWQPLSFHGSELFGEPGALAWAECTTRDGAGADAFYRGLFGYEQEQIGGGQMDYVVYKVGGEAMCGRMQMGAEFEGIPAHWMIYFAVENADAAAARVKELGGKVAHGPFDSPHGRIAVVADPFGAYFSIVQPNEPSNQAA